MTTAYHFWSPTCAPCKAIASAIEIMKEDFPAIRWVSVNTHLDAEGYSSRYNVNVVPTIVVVYQDGTTDRHSGTNLGGYYRILRAKQ